MGGHPIATPTKDEVSMAQAYTIAMRSADLNRQVGAVLVDDDGSILASGCNEVPKFGGGLYWPIPSKDQRDYYVVKEGIPISIGIKKEIANNLIEKIMEKIKKEYPRVRSINYDTLKEILSRLILEKGELKDIIEFLRPVHGEEAAICDAALRGVPTKNATLYCNTYPCHLCTKKIIAAGIKRVVYIEAYPKSKAEELYENIIIDKPPQPEDHPDKVLFESFTGFSPKRYFYMFNLKYKHRIDIHKKVIPVEKLRLPHDIIYVSNYTIIGYFLKEISYIQWTINKFQIDGTIKETIEQFNNLIQPFIEDINEETKWLDTIPTN